MSRIGLVGPSYPSLSPNADAQVCRNWILERIESDQGKGPFALYDREGLVLFSQLPIGPVRGEFTIDSAGVDAGRTFAVGGGVLYEVLANGTANPLANVNNDGLPAYFAANATQTQVAVSSGGTIYVITLATGIVTTVPASTFAQGLIAWLGFMDGFFIALIQNSNFFYLSALEDATTWPGLSVNQVSRFYGNIRGALVDHAQLYLLGNTRGIVYYNQGGANTPFAPIPGGNIENGTGAPASLMRLDNSCFWLDADERGNGIARRDQSYAPQRISNHAVETIWQTYPKMTDAIGFAYQNGGHSFAVFYFPSAFAGKGATWVYDVATGLWHDRDNWISASATSQAYLARCHTFNFGKHLMGDWNSGNIYSLSSTVISDNGGVIRRVRRAPHISAEQRRIYHHELQVDVEVGLGPQPPLLDGAGNPRGPQLMLRWSDTSAKTWSNEYMRDCGQAGQYTQRVRWTRLGQSRDRIYELVATDPVPFRIIDAYLQASGAATYQPQERLVKELGKRA